MGGGGSEKTLRRYIIVICIYRDQYLVLTCGIYVYIYINVDSTGRLDWSDTTASQETGVK